MHFVPFRSTAKHYLSKTLLKTRVPLFIRKIYCKKVSQRINCKALADGKWQSLTLQAYVCWHTILMKIIQFPVASCWIVFHTIKKTKMQVLMEHTGMSSAILA